MIGSPELEDQQAAAGLDDAGQLGQRRFGPGDVADAEADGRRVGPAVGDGNRGRVAADERDLPIEGAGAQLVEADAQHRAGEVDADDPGARGVVQRRDREVGGAGAEIERRARRRPGAPREWRARASARRARR